MMELLPTPEGRPFHKWNVVYRYAAFQPHMSTFLEKKCDCAGRGGVGEVKCKVEAPAKLSF